MTAAPGTPPAGEAVLDAPGKAVLDADGIRRAVSRMAHEVLERDADADGLTVVGIPTRGAALAERLADRMSALEGAHVRRGSLDVTLHRDDLHLRGARPLARTTLVPADVEDRVVVLVDDVLFSGRTVAAALDALGELGRPRAVRLVVLVDRGHRALPLRADAVGKNLPTALSETVRVRLVEHDGVDEVRIVPGGDAAGAGAAGAGAVA